MKRRFNSLRLASITLACGAALACGQNADPGNAGTDGSSGSANGLAGAGSAHAGANPNQATGGGAGSPTFGGGTGGSTNGGTPNVELGGGGALSGGGANAGSANGGVNAGGANAGSANGGASGGRSGGVGGSSGRNGGVGGSSGGGAGTGPWQFPAGVTKPRIMIVGDSISAGPGCYKKYLLQDLTNGHYSNFQFVGEYNDDCGGLVKHSAVSCSTAEQYTHPTFTMSNCSVGVTFKGLSSLMTSQKPDLVMLQLGVNDVWGGKSVDAILGSYTTLVQQARAANPAVVLVVAEIQKINPSCSTDPALTNQAQALDKAVPAWAKSLSTTISPVFTADLWTNSDPTKAETIDCVHPNDVGAQKMGMNWYNALKGILTPS